ncbi:MAG: glycoside hydrolase family 31 protein, partial [Anaerolineales bacterium]|nr:glycoside hydrolase family 31 protein [Anaerolineales bacterium]
MHITEFLQAVRWVGLHAAWEALRFAWLRDRWEAQNNHTAPAARTTPGDVVRVEQRPQGAVFIFEHAQLSLDFLSNWALRATWTPGDPPAPYSLAHVPDPPPHVELERRETRWHLSTPEISAQVDQEGGLSLFSALDELLEELPPPVRTGEAWVQRAELQLEARVFGLGERAAPLNLRPGRYRLWNTDVGGAYGPGDDPLYLSAPIYMCLHAHGGYLLYFENPHDGRVELGDHAEFDFAGGRLQYVFIAGDPPSALQRLSRLIGHPAMPPRWALGFHQSRWGYTNEDDVMEIIEGFERHDLPLSALHLDIDYMRGYRVFTIDRDRFPDLAGLSEACMRRLGARLVAIIDPGVKIDRSYDV